MENNKKISTIEELAAVCKTDESVLQMRKNVGIQTAPLFKRLLLKRINWEDYTVSESGLILALNYEASNDEKKRGEKGKESQGLGRFVIVERANDCREDLQPGMHVAIILPENSGFGISAKMRIANANGIGTEDYYVVNEHEILLVLVEDRLKRIDSLTEEVDKRDPGILS